MEGHKDVKEESEGTKEGHKERRKSAVEGSTERKEGPFRGKVEVVQGGGGLEGAGDEEEPHPRQCALQHHEGDKSKDLS